MQSYSEMTHDELLRERESLRAAYKKYQEMDLTLNMARGKPSSEQLDLSADLLTSVTADDITDPATGIDTRNYGGVDGLPEARALIASMIDAKPEQVIVYGNSSLNIMFDTVARGMLKGYMGSTPWAKLPEVKWICPCPGYDRHFGVTEYFGIQMINVPMYEHGPDMDMIEELVKDPAVKGCWCVPLYSNPQGYIYSDETVKRFAALEPAAEDFRIFWDNAYCVHHLYDEPDKQGKILNILEECEKVGHPDMVFEFASTSKISFAGAGIAGMATSIANREDTIKALSAQTIGYDKVNQLRHVKFLKDREGIRHQMSKHAESLRPKFEALLNILDEELTGRDAGEWTEPLGGYFVTFTTKPNLASEVIKMAKEVGVTLTGAGAPFPYHCDPENSIIRLAPSYPKEEELEMAIKIFATCVRLATVEKLLG